MLTSRSHPLVKLARGLQVSKQRQQHGLFLAEGRNAVAAALQANWPVRHLLAEEEAPHEATLLPEGVFQRVSRDVLQSVADAQTSPGLIALCELPAPTPADWTHKDGLLLVLHGVGDPGNVGTLIRAADAVGAKGILLTGGEADPYSPKVVRASAGSVFQIPILMPDQRTPEGIRQALDERGIPRVAAIAHEGQSCFEAPWPQRCAVILGHETRGISPVLEDLAQRVTIPMYGQAESLNVAMAGTVLLYAWRQGQR